MSEKKGELIVLVLIALSFLWYLMADRYTPYTSQARIESYVVGIAPEVSGIVEAVLIENNQEVEKGQVLFNIDQSQYQIALQAAQSQLDSTWKQVEAGNASVLAARAALDSAIANAEHNEGADIDELWVNQVMIDEAPTMKRFRARAKGRGTRILKRNCHITLSVSDEPRKS